MNFLEPWAEEMNRDQGARPQNDFLVEAVVYLDGNVFSQPAGGGEPLPYTALAFNPPE